MSWGCVEVFVVSRGGAGAINSGEGVVGVFVEPLANGAPVGFALGTAVDLRAM